MGVDPAKIILLVQWEDFDWSFAHSVSLQSALENFSGQITYHLPSHKLMAKFTQISLWPQNSQEPVQGPTLSTAEGNVRADKLSNPVWVAPEPDTLTQPKASHGFFHQNGHTLQKQFQLMPTEAHDIVESWVNPRGLRALEIWQTDVTQIAEFGWLKYVHVTVDTFSSVMWASAHTGEKACNVIAPWRQAFAVLGTTSAVKTDNGPAYASQQVWQLLQSW
ncbi:hypothetical protein DV515_00011662, partial [Chloebia gouldiae]